MVNPTSNAAMMRGPSGSAMLGAAPYNAPNMPLGPSPTPPKPYGFTWFHMVSPTICIQIKLYGL